MSKIYKQSLQLNDNKNNATEKWTLIDICAMKIYKWTISTEKMLDIINHSVQFSCSGCLTLCDPMAWSTPGLPVHHQLLELAQTHVHRVSDAIQPSCPLSSPSLLAFNFSQHQGLFQWVSSSHQVAKVLEFQLQHQSFPWIFRTDFL